MGEMNESPALAQSLQPFLDRLASRAATPGGGSASALVGAIAAALSAMVGRLNDGKDGSPGPLHDTIVAADALRRDLAGLIDEDMAAFDALSASWKLPDDAEHAAEKQAAVVRATQSPLDIMRRALDVMRLAVDGLEKSKRNCLSDAGVAGICAFAALESARLNVLINLPGVSNVDARERFRSQCDAIRDEAAGLKRQIDKLLLDKYG